MACQMSEEQLGQMKEAFNMFDTDGSGCISASELGTVMKSLGHNLSEAELKAMVKVADTDGNGTIDFNNFVAMMGPTEPKLSEEDIRQAFSAFDKDGTGFITTDELKSVIKHLPEGAVDALMQEADSDEDGRINYKEFMKLMTS